MRGETGSERLFALITREIEAGDGDGRAGIVASVGWVAETLPLHSLNFVLATSNELWALRCPDSHRLVMLE